MAGDSGGAAGDRDHHPGAFYYLVRGGSAGGVYRGAAGADLYLEIILFLAVSLVLLLFTRPVVMRYLNANKTATNVDSPHRRAGHCHETHQQPAGQGEVMVGGTPWSARKR